MNNSIEDKYINGDYIDHNPTWDIEHAPRKAKELLDVLSENALKDLFGEKKHIIEIGCGAGGVLYNFSQLLNDRGIENVSVGYDISPKAIEMANKRYGDSLKFVCSKQIDIKHRVAVILLVDVLEHIEEPGVFLQSNKEVSDYFLIRLPLDRSFWNIILNKLPKLEKELGHIHYFTYKSALNFVKSQGLDVLSYCLTKNFNADNNRRTIISKIMWPVRLFTSALSSRINSLLWGGNSIIIFAKVKS